MRNVRARAMMVDGDLGIYCNCTTFNSDEDKDGSSGGVVIGCYTVAILESKNTLAQ
jgi:hypothetical protein